MRNGDMLALGPAAVWRTGGGETTPSELAESGGCAAWNLADHRPNSNREARPRDHAEEGRERRKKGGRTEGGGDVVEMLWSRWRRRARVRCVLGCGADGRDGLRCGWVIN